MKKVAVIGFEPYDEKMYPHLYDVLKIIEDHCDLIYFGEDDRGSIRYRLGITKPPIFQPQLWAGFLKFFLASLIRIYKKQKGIKKLMGADAEIIVAIDHSALHHASKYLKENTRLIFWSHDIISADHEWMKSYWIRRLIKSNRKDIKKCALIIIQDKNREAVLDDILNSYAIPKFFLPVSLEADPFTEAEAKRRASKILNGNITLMQLGSIALGRNSRAIINAYQKLPDNILLILKGFISDDIRMLVEKADRKPGVYPRSKNYKEMREFINQADIGIIACELKDINNYYVSMASGQLVEYLKLGIPVIILDMGELGEFVDRHKCGLFISNESQLKSAIQEITKNYCDYSRAALSTYKKFYDIGLYRDSIITNLLLKFKRLL